MKKKILLTIGALSSVIAPVGIVVSCNKNEQSENTLKHIVSFTLKPDNLGLKNIEKMNGSELRELKNYPYSVVEQNQLISNSNNTYDVEGKTYLEILNKISQIKIENDVISDAFGLKRLIQGSNELLMSGMGFPITNNQITEENFRDIYNKAEKIYADMGMPNHADLTLNTFFKGQFGSENVPDGLDFYGYWKLLRDGIKNIKTKEDITPQSPYEWKDIPAYLSNKHIYLYDGKKKIINFNDEVKNKNVNLTIKIEE